ncbi:hypothetical protein ES703_51280 [subsurface metagenome]
MLSKSEKVHRQHRDRSRYGRRWPATSHFTLALLGAILGLSCCTSTATDIGDESIVEASPEFLDESAEATAVQWLPDQQKAIERLYKEIIQDLSPLSGPHPRALPEGRSVFFGEYTCAQGLAGSIVVVYRSGGDLTLINLHGAPVSKKNPQPVGHFLFVEFLA